MKIVTISDTHGFHSKLRLPPGDVLIHAGDISMKGEESEIDSFLSWFKNQNFKTKIFIAGNHDFYFENHTGKEITERIPADIIYLNDSQITIEGLKIWGSPITPYFFNWAFNRHRGDQISRHWEIIPPDTDILITHGPMFRRLDSTREGQHVGCKDLFLRSQELSLKAHIFGHIHEDYGQKFIGHTHYINASVVNYKYELVNAPIVLDF